VADSEGHSAPATVMMAMTCALFRACPELHADPDRVLATINANLCKVNRESFVTAIYAVLDPRSRRLRVARAGHPLPILFRPAEGRARELSCDGVFMMGFDPYDRVPVTDIQLEAGDRLLFYTDGVSERFNTDRQPYGEDRICGRMELPAAGPAELVASLMQDLEAFAAGRPADDDQTLLLGFID
jgi:sigma-B regulation protein RsbU (phosphoserine phosphatase)